MIVVITPHALVLPDLRAWRRSLSADPAEANTLAALFIGELERRAAAANGVPASARTDRRTDPPTYWVELTGGTWLRLRVKPDRRVGLMRTLVGVTQLGTRAADLSTSGNGTARL